VVKAPPVKVPLVEHVDLFMHMNRGVRREGLVESLEGLFLLSDD